MATGFVNPIGAGLSGARIDMGVDFTGSGSLFAIGSGEIVNVYNAGWPGGVFIGLKLDNGNYVYYAEHISPKVRVGQKVKAGDLIGYAPGGYPFIEIGWAAPPGTGQTMADKAGQDKAGLAAGDPGKYPTAYGVSMANLIKSLGGPAGIVDGPIQGTVPAGFTGTSGAIASPGPAPGQANPSDLKTQAAAGVSVIVGSGFAFILLGLLLVPAGFFFFKTFISRR